MQRTRIVIVGMPRMMQDLIESILVAQPDFVVTGRVAPGAEWPAALRQQADVVVMDEQSWAGSAETTPTAPCVSRPFCCRPCRVVTLASDGRRGALWVPRPFRTPVDELSAEALVSAIRGAEKPGADDGVGEAGP